MQYVVSMKQDTIMCFDPAYSEYHEPVLLTKINRYCDMGPLPDT